MRRFRAIIESNKEPKDREVLWLLDNTLLYFNNGEWTSVTTPVSILNADKEVIKKIFTEDFTTITDNIRALQDSNKINSEKIFNLENQQNELVYEIGDAFLKTDEVRDALNAHKEEFQETKEQVSSLQSYTNIIAKNLDNLDSEVNNLGDSIADISTDLSDKSAELHDEITEVRDDAGIYPFDMFYDEFIKLPENERKEGTIIWMDQGFAVWENGEYVDNSDILDNYNIRPGYEHTDRLFRKGIDLYIGGEQDPRKLTNNKDVSSAESRAIEQYLEDEWNEAWKIPASNGELIEYGKVNKTVSSYGITSRSYIGNNLTCNKEEALSILACRPMEVFDFSSGSGISDSNPNPPKYAVYPYPAPVVSKCKTLIPFMHKSSSNTKCTYLWENAQNVEVLQWPNEIRPGSYGHTPMMIGHGIQSKLKSIRGTINLKIMYPNTVFSNLSALTTINIYAQDGLNFGESSKLSLPSLQFMAEHKVEGEGDATIILHQDAYNRLTDEIIETARGNGVTFVTSDDE